MSSVSRCGKLAEGVYLRLYYYVGKGDNGVLYSRGNAESDYLTHHVSMEAELFYFYGEHSSLFHKVDHAKHEACALRNDRSYGG